MADPMPWQEFLEPTHYAGRKPNIVILREMHEAMRRYMEACVPEYSQLLAVEDALMRARWRERLRTKQGPDNG